MFEFADIMTRRLPSGSVKSVLVVDDEQFNLSVISALCSRLGVSEVVTAASGEEALKVLSNGNFDLALVDLVMPGMDGWELIGRIRSDGKLADMPVYAVTAEVLPAAQVREKGFTDVLAKPVTTEGLRTLFMAYADGSALDAYWPMEPEPGIRHQADWMIVTLGNVGNRPLTRGTSFIDDLGYDSMDMVEFALEFKGKFGIEIPPEELPAVKTVGDVYDILVKRLRSCGAVYGRRRISKEAVSRHRAHGCVRTSAETECNLPPDCRVIAADDMAICRRMLSHSLSQLGVKDLEVVDSGAAVIEAAKAKVPSLVITDLWMPGMNGDELLRQLRSVPGCEHTPVVCVTADDAADRTYDLSGFAAMLVKPVTVKALGEVVSGLMEGGDK